MLTAQATAYWTDTYYFPKDAMAIAHSKSKTHRDQDGCFFSLWGTKLMPFV